MSNGAVRKLLRAVVAPAATMVFVFLAMSMPIRADVEGECVHGYDPEGNIVPCDDGGGDYEHEDYSGYGGGGCASSPDYAYDSGAASYADQPAGSPNPDYANVVMGADGNWHPAPGYDWASSDTSDYTVVRVVGAGHPDFPNIVMTETGWATLPGYRWASSDMSDLSTVRDIGAGHPDFPNIVMTETGWTTLPGYRWASSDMSDLSTVRDIGATHPEYPSIVMTETGWTADLGFEWASSDTNDLSVRPIVGMEHPSHPNVVMGADGRWQPGEGYRWAGDPTNLTAEPITVAAIAPPEGSQPYRLRIVDVPSPSGFKSESERREQVARLSDQQIEAEIERTRRLLERMQADFANDSGSIEGWVQEAQAAEYEAVMAGFKLLIDGSLGRFAAGWKQYPKLKQIAEAGMTYLEFEGPVTGLATNMDDYNANMEMARSLFIELYKKVQGFDERLISESGVPAAQFADFVVTYSYQVARWGLAYESIKTITENLDNPDGKLKAQLVIKRVYEDLIQERKRRQG